MTTRPSAHWFHIALAALALAVVPSVGQAGWSVDPTPIHSTVAKCAPVTACDDGAGGAIVSWFEYTDATSGVYHSRHVLATGDIDPAWPSLVALNTSSTPPMAMGSVADELGGAYVWWQINRSLLLTRIGPDGAIAPGWPAAGRQVGTLFHRTIRPSAISDGKNGIYLSWIQIVFGPLVGSDVRAIHIGPANTGAGGWPNTSKSISANAPYISFVQASAISLAPDGGLWVAWGESIFHETLGHLPGPWMLMRLRTSGLPAPGWLGRGTILGRFDGNLIRTEVPPMNLVAVASDGADGAYVLRGDPRPEPPGTWTALPLLNRYDVDGRPAPGWPDTGLLVQEFSSIGQGAPSEMSYRALRAGGTGVLAGVPLSYTHGAGYAFSRFALSSAREFDAGVGFDDSAFEVGQEADEIYSVTCNPSGPTGPYQPPAFIAASRLEGGDFAEYHDDPVVTWYGDVALAVTNEGNALFFWSQTHERFGIYAIELTPHGRVTAAPPAARPSALRLSLRWIPGEGLRADAAFARAGRATLTLHDVAGRTLASTRFEAGTGALSWALPATEALAPGLYFARLASGDGVATAKVVVSR